MNARRKLLAGCLLIAILAGCGGSETPPPQATPAAAEPAAMPEDVAMAEEMAADPGGAEMPAGEPPAESEMAVDPGAEAVALPEMNAEMAAMDAEMSAMNAEMSGPPRPRKKREPATPPPPPTADYKLDVDEELIKQFEQAIATAKTAEAAVSPLKMIGLAMHNYAKTYSHLPGAGSAGAEDSPVGLSWRVHLLPFIGEQELYEQFDLEQPWDSAQNRKLLTKMPSEYGDSLIGKTRLHVFTGKHAPFQDGRPLSFEDVTDNLSHTVMVVRAGKDKDEFWTRPGGLEFNPRKPAECLGKIGPEMDVIMFDGVEKTLPVVKEELVRRIQHNDGGLLPEQEAALAEQAANPVLTETVAARPALEPLPKAFDAKLIPDEALFAAVMYPRHAMEHPLVTELISAANYTDQSAEEFLHTELLGDAGRMTNQFGLKLEGVEEVRFITAPASSTTLPPIDFGNALGSDEELPEQEPYAFLGYLKSSLPLDLRDSFFKNISEDPFLISQMHEGVLWLSAEETGFYIALPNLNEVFVTNDLSLFTAAMQATGSGKIVNQMGKNGSVLLQLSADLPPELWDKAAPLARQASPQAQLVLPLLQKVNQLSLAFDLDAVDMLSVAVGSNDPAAAEQWAGMLDAQMATAKTMYQATRGGLQQGGSPELTRIIDDLIAGLTHSAKEGTLTLAIERPQDLDNLPTALEPMLATARNAAQAAQNRNRMRQFALAMHNYNDVNGHFPCLNGPGDRTTNSNLSWRVYLLPYLENEQMPQFEHELLFRRFRLNEPWDSEHNKALIRQMPPIFGSNPEGKTTVHVITGQGAAFQNNRGITMPEITDGTSSTIMIVDAAPDTADVWTKPGGLTLAADNPVTTLGNFGERARSFSAVFFDGSVHELPLTINGDTLRRLIQPTDGQPVEIPRATPGFNGGPEGSMEMDMEMQMQMEAEMRSQEGGSSAMSREKNGNN